MLAGESVLECMERHGESVPSSCRSGVCRSCTLRAVKGSVPASAQVGLRHGQKARGYFLACQCHPTEDIQIGDDEDMPPFESEVLHAEPLARGVSAVWLRRPEGFSFEAGQFVQVRRPEDGLTRPYSVASLPDADALELHVSEAPKGRMSGWLPRATGQRVQIRGPLGECTFQAQSEDDPLLLAGSGTGLAPLLGVIRAALRVGHRGPLRLYHAARSSEGLYARAHLDELAAAHPNLELTYVCESPNTEPDLRIERGALDTVVTRDLEQPRDLRAYLCGNPNLVNRLRKQLYLAGMALDRIHSDAFVEAPPPTLN